MSIVLNIHRDGQPFTMGDTQSKVLVSPATGSKYLTFNYIRYAPDAEFPQHVHEHSEDVFFVVEGDGWLCRGDERTPLGPGDVVFVPPGEQHGTLAGPNGMVVVSCQGPPDVMLYTGERDSSRPPAAPPASPPLSAAKQNGIALLFALLFGAVLFGFIWLHARPNPEALYQKGVAALDAKDYDGAIAHLTRCLELNPLHSEARSARGQAYDSKRDYAAAIRDYDAVIRQDRRAAGAYCGRGVCHATLGNYDQAIADLHDAVRYAPKWADAYECRAYVFTCRKQYLNALADYAEAIQLEPGRASPRLGRAKVFYEEKKYDRALEDLARVLNLEPKNELAYVIRGMIHTRQNEPGRAVNDFRQAIADHPDSHHGHDALAWLLATHPKDEVRNGAKAIEHARRACEATNWEDGNCLESLAAAYAEAGQYGNAVRWQEKALSLPTVVDDDGHGPDRLKAYRKGEPWRDHR